MLHKFYSKFLYRRKERSHQKDQRTPTLQKHWKDVMLGIRKSFLPLPREAEFDISIESVRGLQAELDGIHKKLSTLVDKKPCK